MSQPSRLKSRLLKASSAAHSSARQAQQERQHALRYRKVKFFERQKATRRLCTLRKKLAGASMIERPRLSEELDEVLLDLEYIKHFPTTQRYIALYASAEDDPKTCQRRAEIREQVRARRQTGRYVDERAGTRK